MPRSTFSSHVEGTVPLAPRLGMRSHRICMATKKPLLAVTVWLRQLGRQQQADHGEPFSLLRCASEDWSL